MRRRSNTIYAENVTEYTEKAVDNLNNLNKPRKLSTKKKINASSLLPMLFTEDQRKETSTPTNGDHWSGFDFDVEKPSSESFVKPEKNKAIRYQHFEGEASCCTDSTEDTLCSSPDSMRRCVTRKFMVIGMGGTGRHSLVNSIFDLQKRDGQDSMRQTMDLIIKTRKEMSQETKYQFWMKALNDSKFDGLVKMYYRIASVFFFVYSVTDRNSFEKLSEAIETVLKEVPREKFVGVLIANKCDLEDQREVGFFEGIALKEKYDLSLFVETHQESQGTKNQLMNFLERQN